MTIRQWSVRRNEKIACHVTVRGEKAEVDGLVSHQVSTHYGQGFLAHIHTLEYTMNVVMYFNVFILMHVKCLSAFDWTYKKEMRCVY